MESKKRNRGGKKSGRGGFQQHQDRDQPRSSGPTVESTRGTGHGPPDQQQSGSRAGGSFAGPSFRDSGFSGHNIPQQRQQQQGPVAPVQSARFRGPPLQHGGPVQPMHWGALPGAGGSFAGPSFRDSGFSGHYIPQQRQQQQGPVAPVQSDSRFSGPPLQHGGQVQPMRWRALPGGPRPSRPAFSPQRTPHPSHPSASPTVREQPVKSAWGSESVSSDVPAQDSQASVAWPRKFEPGEKTVDPKSGPGKVQVRESKPEIAQPQTPEKSTETQASSSTKSVGKKKKRKGGGIGDKPLEESLDTALVLGSSSQSHSKTQAKAEKAAAPAKPVQEPVEATVSLYNIPKRPKGILAHSTKYFRSEAGCPLEVNLLRIDLKNLKLKIFQYDVTFDPIKRKELFREAIRLLFEQNGINRHPAYDGRAQLYAAGSPIRFPGGTDSFTGTVELSYGEGRPINYTITLKLTREINLQSLAEYMRNGSSLNPFDIQPLEIALMHPAMSTDNLIKAGRSFFTRPNNPVYLGNGMDLWKGHSQSVVIPWLDETKGTPHLYLNVDVAHKAFPKAQPVIDYIRQEFFSRDSRYPLRNDTRLAPWQCNAVRDFLKGVKVMYNDGVRRRTLKVDDLGESARNARFRLGDNEAEITVETYFRTNRNIRLQYPNLPCINSRAQDPNVPRNRRDRLFPIELCSVVPNQVVNKALDRDQTDKMVVSAARPTFERKYTIDKSLKNIRFNGDECMQEFGLTVSTTFETVSSYELKPPSIKYANVKKTVRVDGGVWRQNDAFITPVNLSKWILINTDDRIDATCVGNIIRDFQDVGRSCGVRVEYPQQVDLFSFRNEYDFANIFKEWKSKGAQCFMVILKDRHKEIYSYVKQAAELQIGVLTQCLKASTARQTFEGRFRVTASNILLKLNAKINGVNHTLAAELRPEILNEDVMIVGADVTHPPPDSNDLSIAAVAASHDKFGFQYNMQYRLQASRNEMIRDLKKIMEDQISFYQKNNGGKIPKRILYYRDGVADSQFEKVLSFEVQAIQRACAKLATRPTLTFIVVQKRHHVRFFPNQQMADRSDFQNVRPGTLVDEKITHPTEMNFYLVSHKSIQGTARPTKYHLLYDDSSPAIDLIMLERLTYYLCHMYARCNRSVSYPAPTYYAHWAAFRAKAWWTNIFSDFRQRGEDPARLINEQDRRGRVLDDVVNFTPMFFI